MKQWFKKFAAVFAALCVLVCSVPLGGSVAFATYIGTHVFYDAKTYLEPVDASHYMAGCYTCTAAMMLSTLGKNNATPSDIWRLNGNSVYLTSDSVLASTYNVSISTGTLSGTSNDRYTKIKQLCEQYPQGIFLQGTVQKGNNKGVDHAVVAYMENGTLKINNPGWTTWSGRIVGSTDNYFSDYSTFYKYRIFQDKDSSTGETDNPNQNPAITFNNVYANSITETTAHVQADVTKNRALSQVGVKWGTTTAMTETPLTDSVGSVLTKIYYDFGQGGYPSLQKGTTYYYQFFAKDTSGNYYYSDQKSFRTSGTSGNNPKGCVDNIYGDMYGVWLSGWAFDWDSPKSPLDVVLFIDDEYAGTLQANVQRTDVNDAYPGAGNYHGFNYLINTNKTGYHKVDVYAINVGEGDNTCLGTYYLTILKDEEEPVISDVRVTDRTSTGYTVTCTVTDNYYVDRVQFPTWTVENWQDDLAAEWRTNTSVTGARNGNTWSFRVNAANHNNEAGEYQTLIFAYDKEGNSSYVSVDIVNVDATPPEISNIEVTDITPEGYTVRCTVTDNDAVDRVQFPTWTVENGQDDLLANWNTEPAASGTPIGNNVYEFRVKASDHNNEVGIYRTHIYAWDACGNMTSLGSEEPLLANIDTNALRGDLNGDGRVSVHDIVRLRRILVGLEPEVPLARGDVNGDGRISVHDLVALRRLILQQK